MGAKISQIARNGMKGRKKDTLLLIIVITMSFFFIVLATLLEGSFQKTEEAQRTKLYGSWHAAYLSGDDDILQRMEQHKEISKIGKSYLFNTISNVGTIGTYNQELLDMGEFTLLEGTYPKNPGEIMVESSKVSELGLKDPIGQTVSVVYEIVLKKGTDEELNQYMAQVLEDYKKKLAQQGIDLDEQKNTPDLFYEGLPYAEYGMKDYQHRTIDYEYRENDITLTLSNLYHINYFSGETPGPEEIRKKGLLRESILRVNVKYTICGVISDYSDRWDVGYYTLANSFITEEDGNNIIDIIRGTKLADLSDYAPEASLNLFLTSDILGEDLFSVLAPEFLSKQELENITGTAAYGELSSAVTVDNAKFRKNNLAYPAMKGSTESTLLILIIGIIFLATVVSVFQIFLSQIKRRSRKIALLKSIGATNGQIIRLMAWEGVYLLLTSLPAGLLLGFGISYVVLLVMRLFKHTAMIFYADVPLVGLGLLAGIVSVLIGMVVPSVNAARIPLVGTMNEPPKRLLQKYKKKASGRQGSKSMKPQSFRTVSLRHLSVNRGKALLNLTISAITISIMLSTVFLCYMAFRNYNKSVAIPGRPDYTMELPYGLEPLYIVHYGDAIKKIPGVKYVNGYRKGENLHLYFSGMEQDETLAQFYKLLPDSKVSEHFAPGYGDGKALGNYYGADYVDKALLTNLYGIDMTSDFGKKCMASITEGKLDKQAFSEGKEVILVLPMQNKGEAKADSLQSNDLDVLNRLSKYSRMKWLLQMNQSFDLTLSKRYKELYQKNLNVKVGDTITLSANEEITVGDSIITSYTPYEVKVAGIISYFPKDNLWPFSETSQSYAVICSNELFSQIYKASDSNAIFNDGTGYYTQMLQMYMTKFGSTVYQIYADGSADRIKTDKRMIEFASSISGSLYNYRESNQILHKEAINNALIIGLLGFATSAIAIFILYNILVSMAIQNKARIGILQSIGVTNRQLIRLQLVTGLVFSLISLAIAHVIVLLIMFLTPFGSAGDITFTFFGYIKDVFMRLELYPWGVHSLICIVFIALTVMVYYLSSIKIIRQSPVENMNR